MALILPLIYGKSVRIKIKFKLNDKIWILEMIAKEKNKSRNPEILKILMLGDSNVGITTFIKKVCTKDFKQPQIPITGVESSVKFTADDTSGMYQFGIVKKESWNKFRSIRFSNSTIEGVLVMVDVTNLESYYPISIETGLHVERCFKSLVESVAGKSKTSKV